MADGFPSTVFSATKVEASYKNKNLILLLLQYD